MRLADNGKITFSPSDLIVFSKSPFASWMEHAVKAGSLPDERGTASAEMDLLAKMGDEHEKKVLDG